MDEATKAKAIEAVIEGLRGLGYDPKPEAFTATESHNRLYPDHIAVIDTAVNRVYYVKM